ncbi:MAG: Hsp20/alpha crystallin family protein [Candidatus Lernaella stagnicola]|nr:Hsp20/alpha crystallin family protein [Candidatus Lernaella stagnicola]
MTLVRWRPIRERDQFHHDMNRLFDSFWTGRAATEGIAGAWTPAVNIYEDDDRYTVSVALPGLTESDVHVNIENNMLTISGERKLENEDAQENYKRIEQYYGEFTRSFALPNTIDTEQVEATMDKGVLHVALPKRAETKPRSIEVKVH